MKHTKSIEELQALLHAGYGDGTVLTNGQAWEFAEMLWPMLSQPPAQEPLTDDQWLEYLLKHAPANVLQVGAFVGQSIQTQGRWMLYADANELRKLVETAHGIGGKK